MPPLRFNAQVAAAKGDIPIVDILLNNGADPMHQVSRPAPSAFVVVSSVTAHRGAGSSRARPSPPSPSFLPPRTARAATPSTWPRPGASTSWRRSCSPLQRRWATGMQSRHGSLATATRRRTGAGRRWMTATMNCDVRPSRRECACVCVCVRVCV